MADSDRHRNKLVVGIRGADEQLRDAARTAAKAAGYAGLSDATLAHWRWLARQPGAADPRRPDPTAEVAANLLHELGQAVDALAEQDPAGARRIMSNVSSFETDWWGTHG